MMSALSTSQRTGLLTTIVEHFAQRVNTLLDFAASHPNADLAQLEAQAHQLSVDCFAPLLQAIAQQQAPAAETATLAQPPCHHPLRYKGAHSRTILTRVGAITLRRSYLYCEICRSGCFPLDHALGLPRGQFSDGVQQAVSRFAAELPFEQAAASWADLSGLPISGREIGRISEQRGSCLTNVLAARQKLLEDGGQLPADAQPPRQLSAKGAGIWAVALDAAKVQFRDDWHEVKAGVVFWAQPKYSEQPQQPTQMVGAQASAQSYIALVGTMQQAAGRLAMEASRRGIAAEATVVCLGDGAPSIWAGFASYFPRRAEVLDWYHALEHLWNAGKGLYADALTAAAWVKQREAELWAGQVEAVLEALRTAAAGANGAAAAAEIGYFETNKGRMDYAAYRAAGYPIGSGSVESACKRVIGARAKGAGMRWSKLGVQAILSLRAELLSGRWAQSWSLTIPA